ncbi:hypothetical protein EEB14_07685 [Rhodococcus sp. WS4]|nr:hypothetical protein [Rhodococcus wratislaviensis]TQC49817.1 hypothetical protein EEB14_07685 [Rhodococcus sp. WS4]GLK33834.1 hypothetical protein GCM10017611_06770 [Rhodococcus wratislaviensis]
MATTAELELETLAVKQHGRVTQEPVVEGDPVPFTSQASNRFGEGARLVGSRELRWWLKSAVSEVTNKMK